MTLKPTPSACATACTGLDLAYRDLEGWIYLVPGRTADWMRVDGENLTAAPPSEFYYDTRLLTVSVCCPDEYVGDR